jgi:hypothetical protein
VSNSSPFNYFFMNCQYKSTAMIFLIFPLLICCKDINKDEAFKIKSIQLISEKYSREAFNYLYEVCFFDEVGKKKVHLAKWKENVKYYVSGRPSEQDIEMVMKAIIKLNDLKLPITFQLVKRRDDSNVSIYFGDTVSLKPLGLINNFEGLSIVTSTNGIIDSAKILISDHSINLLKKESVILEEMTQVIGLTADSYTYPESLFYDGENSVIKFQPLDIEMIQLLYDSMIPANYCLDDYRRDFGDMVDYFNTSDKLRKMFTSTNVKQSTLEEIRNACYLEGEFYKHSSNIPVYLSGFNHEDSSFVLRSIDFLNTLSEKLNLRLADQVNDVNSTGISIGLFSKDMKEYSSQTRITSSKGQVFRPKRIKSVAEIDFVGSIDMKKKRSVILKAIYKSLGPTEMHFEDDWFTYDGEKVTISQKYADIIRIIYSDEFVDGYPLKEFEELIESF